MKRRPGSKSWDWRGRGTPKALARKHVPIPPGTPCEHCGATDKALHRHHPDYRRPIDVLLLCQPCHMDLHRRENAPEIMVNRLDRRLYTGKNLARLRKDWGRVGPQPVPGDIWRHLQTGGLVRVTESYFCGRCMLVRRLSGPRTERVLCVLVRHYELVTKAQPMARGLLRSA